MSETIIIFLVGIVAGALLIEIIDLHRNKVEMEKFQDANYEDKDDSETYFTVCLEDGLILKIKGESVSNGLCSAFYIDDEDGNTVFKTSLTNIKWWSEYNHLVEYGKEDRGDEDH